MNARVAGRDLRPRGVIDVLSPAFSPSPLCVLVAALFGCGPGRNTFAPECPTARLIPALADVTRYAGPGPAHDVTDLILQARVIAVNGSCRPATTSGAAGQGAGHPSVQRGPAMQGREADVPVFLAVTEGDTRA